MPSSRNGINCYEVQAFDKGQTFPEMIAYFKVRTCIITILTRYYFHKKFLETYNITIRIQE